jgi:hypothetical protein
LDGSPINRGAVEVAVSEAMLHVATNQQGEWRILWFTVTKEPAQHDLQRVHTRISQVERPNVSA